MRHDPCPADGWRDMRPRAGSPPQRLRELPWCLVVLGLGLPAAQAHAASQAVPILLTSGLAFAAAVLGARWLGPAWDAFAQRHINDISPRLRALGLDDTNVSGWLRWWGVAMFATFLFVGVILQMLPVAVGATLLVFVAPRLILDRMIAQRQIKLRDQLVRATVGIANGCRAGLSLLQSIEKAAQESPPPLADELTRIVRYCRGGIRIQDALRETQLRLDLEAFTVFASAAIVSVEQGGNLTLALEKISEGLQEMQRLERKLEADSASGRKLALVLGVFPIFFLAGFTLLDPVSMGLLYSTFVGNVILCLVGCIVFGAFKWCQAILNLDF
ncbi:MAG: type II secretion system F family protein [Pirellulaceae bacterium]